MRKIYPSKKFVGLGRAGKKGKFFSPEVVTDSFCLLFPYVSSCTYKLDQNRIDHQSEVKNSAKLPALFWRFAAGI